MAKVSIDYLNGLRAESGEQCCAEINTGTWVGRNAYLPCPEHVVQATGLGQEVLYTRMVGVEVLPGENSRKTLDLDVPSLFRRDTRRRPSNVSVSHSSCWFFPFVLILWGFCVSRHRLTTSSYARRSISTVTTSVSSHHDHHHGPTCYPTVKQRRQREIVRPGGHSAFPY